MKHGRSKFSQRGISLLGLLVLGVIAAALVIVGAKVAPTVSEYFSIIKTAKKVADNSSGADSLLTIRRNFDLAASADYITSISSKDLEITKRGDKVVISFAYDKEISLIEPVYLLIKYSGTTETGYR
jgi:hypothetical protein